MSGTNDRAKDNKYGVPTVRFNPTEDEIESWLTDLNALTFYTDLDSTMKALATIVHEYDEHQMDHLQCKVYHRALDWLATLKSNLEKAHTTLDAIRVTEYEAGCADSDGKLVHGTEHVMCMAYSTDIISDEDAEQVLKSGAYHNDPRVVILDPVQAAALFPALRERSEADEKSKNNP